MTAQAIKDTYSVILCTYTEDRWNNLKDAVDSVRHQTLPAYEIVVAVDHNRRLFDLARRNLPDVIVVESYEVPGISGTRNSGVTAAHGSHIVFLDEDAIAASDWLARLSSAFADPLVKCAGGSAQPAWVGGRPAWFPPEFDWVVGCTYRGMLRTSGPVRNLIGCNMAFRREVFAIVGGFRHGRVGPLALGKDDDETEFCIRLTEISPEAKVWYEPAAVVRHTVPRGRATLAYFTRRCFSEGLSKARLSRQLGRTRALSAELVYVFRTLPNGILRDLRTTLLLRESEGVLRAGAIIAGLAFTAAGYLAGSVSQLVASLWGVRSGRNVPQN
jgi:glycosyltransferase involved in cell wall biosynthesis